MTEHQLRSPQYTFMVIVDDKFSEERQGLTALSEYQKIIELQLPTEDEFYDHYNNYAKMKGFSVRKGRTRKDRNGVVNERRFVCSRAGERRQPQMGRQDRVRRERVITRCHCQAFLEIKFHSSLKRWYVFDFQDQHNHPLAGDDDIVFLRSHLKSGEERREALRRLRNAKVKQGKKLEMEKVDDDAKDEQVVYDDLARTAEQNNILSFFQGC